MTMTDAKRVFNRRLSFAGLNRVFEGSALTGPRTLFWLVTIMLLLCPVISRAQQLTATLSGTVTDSSGAVIPNATVTVTQTATNAVRTAQSDQSGDYAVTSLPAGTYTVAASSSWFENYLAKNVVLNVGEKRGLNIQLKAGSTSTTVTVEAAAVSVDTESSAQAGTISGVQIRELELAGRNFQQLVTLQPGVVSQMADESSASNTLMSVTGART